MRQALATVIALFMAGSLAWAQTMPPMQSPSGPTAPPTPVEPRRLQPTAVQGRIKSLDRSSNTMTLEDGTTLTIPQSVAATGLEEGTRVIVTYEANGDEKVVTSLIQVRESSKS
jgi:uncharacterized protein DUF1344